MPENTENKKLSRGIAHLKIFLLFFFTSLIVGFAVSHFDREAHRDKLLGFILDEFGIEAEKILANDSLLAFQSSDEMDSMISSVDFSEFFVSQGLFEWRGHWEPLFLNSPALADLKISPSDIDLSFKTFGKIKVFSGNKNSIVSGNHILYAAIIKEGRQFVLSVELDDSYVTLVREKAGKLCFSILLSIVVLAIITSLLATLFYIIISKRFVSEVSKSISEETYRLPPIPWPGSLELGKIAIDGAQDASDGRRQKRQAILQTRNEFEEERRDFAMIREVARITGMAPDISSAASGALIPILRKADLRCGAIFSLDSENIFHLVGEKDLPADLADELSFGETEEKPNLLRGDFPDGIEIEPIENVSIFADSPLLSLKEEGLTHCILIPLVYNGKPWGVIHLYSLGHPRMSDKDRTVLLAAADEIALALENKRLLANLDNRIKESFDFYEISKTLISTSDFDMLMENILWIVHKGVGAQYCSILLSDEESENLLVKKSWGYDKEHANLKIPFGSGITGWVAQNGQAVLSNDVATDTRYIPGTDDIRAEMAVPLVADETVIGVIDCESATENAFDEKDLRFLSALSTPAALAIKRSKAQTELAQQLIRDQVTGLYNPSYFDNYIRENGEELLLRHGKVSVAIVNVSNIKKINSNYGTLAGDLVLKRTGEMLGEMFPTGIISRYSGGEFLILLPGVGDEAMLKLVENLRERRIKWTRDHPEAIPLSFTAGYAIATRFEELASVIAAADRREKSDMRLK